MRHPKAVQEVLWGMVDLALKDRNLDLCGAAVRLFGEHQLVITNYDLFMGVVQEVDAYVRAWRCDRLARALIMHPSHIVRGWDYLKDDTRGAEFFPPVDFNVYSHMVPEYRVVANSNPLWRDGIHERSLSAIAYGAIALTDRTVKADTILKDMINYRGFEWDDDLPEIVSEALRLSDQDNADYFDAGFQAFRQNGIADYQTYIEALDKAVANRMIDLQSARL